MSRQLDRGEQLACADLARDLVNMAKKAEASMSPSAISSALCSAYIVYANNYGASGADMKQHIAETIDTLSLTPKGLN